MTWDDQAPWDDTERWGMVFQVKGGESYHDSHRGLEPAWWYDSVQQAQDAGLFPCGVCKP